MILIDHRWMNYYRPACKFNVLYNLICQRPEPIFFCNTSILCLRSFCIYLYCTWKLFQMFLLSQRWKKKFKIKVSRGITTPVDFDMQALDLLFTRFYIYITVNKFYSISERWIPRKMLGIYKVHVRSILSIKYITTASKLSYIMQKKNSKIFTILILRLHYLGSLACLALGQKNIEFYM